MWTTGHIVGFGQLRHRASRGSDLPEGAETHINYSICEPHRRKGYGTALLALLLDEARRIGLEVVRVGADSDNLGSLNVIRNNGGRLVAKFAARAGVVLIFEFRL